MQYKTIEPKLIQPLSTFFSFERNDEKRKEHLRHRIHIPRFPSSLYDFDQTQRTEKREIDQNSKDSFIQKQIEDDVYIHPNSPTQDGISSFSFLKSSGAFEQNTGQETYQRNIVSTSFELLLPPPPPPPPISSQFSFHSFHESNKYLTVSNSLPLDFGHSSSPSPADFASSMSTSPTALHSTMNSHDSIKSASRLDNKIFNPTSNITDSYQNVTKEEIHSPMLGSVFATNSHDSSDHKYQSNSKLANSITEAIPQSTITPTSLKPITSDSPYRSPLSGSPAAVDAPAEWKSMNKTMPSSNFENSSTFRPSPLSSPSGYSNTSTGTMRAESASQEQSDSSLSPQTVEAMMHTLLSILWEREKHRKKEELKIEARETREKDKDDNSEEDDDNDEFERDDSFANCSVIACNEYDKSLHSAPDEAHQMQSQLGSSHKSKANTGIISPMNIKNLQLKSLQMDKLKKKKKKKKKSKKTSKANTRTASPYHLQCFSKDEIDALIKKSSSSASSSASTSSSSSLPLSSKQHQPHHPRNLNFRQSSLSTTKMPHSLSVLLRRSKAETLLLRHQQKLAESSASAAERREREIEKELQREEKEGAKTKRELQKKEEEIRIEKKGADALRKRNVQLASECNRLESELQILKEMRQSQISSSPSALSSRRTSRTLASELKSQRISSKKNPLPKEQ